MLSFVGDSDAHIVRGLIAVLFALYSGKRAREILAHRRDRAVRAARAARAPDAAALERLPLHGRAHPARRARRAGDGGLSVIVASATAQASAASQVAHRHARAARLTLETVMPRQPVEAELQHHLARARRPAALALDVFEPLEEAADVEQQAGEFRSDRIERVVQALTRRACGSARRRAAPPDAAPARPWIAADGLGRSWEVAS